MSLNYFHDQQNDQPVGRQRRMKIITLFLSIPMVLSACGVISQDETHPQDIAASAVPDATSTSFSQLPETSLATSTQFDTPRTSTSTISPTPQKKCGQNERDPKVFIDEFPTFAVREGPGCEYKEIQGKIDKFDPIMFSDVVGMHNDWLLLDFCNNNEGWVFGPAIAEMNTTGMDEGGLPILDSPASPEISPTTTPSSENSLDKARDTLTNFYDNLSNKNYEEATKLFAGGYGIAIMWNSDVDSQDYPTLLMRACEWNGFECFVKVGRIISEEQISSMEYHFIVEFSKEDGSIYQRRGLQDAMVSQFLIRVVRDCNGEYYVVTWPFYEQYGG